MRKVAVLGSGAWGTTLGQVMVDSGQQVLIWGRNKKVVREINRRHSNRRFLKGIDLPRELKATTDIKAVLEFADVILVAIPAQTLRENLVEWKGFFPTDFSGNSCSNFAGKFGGMERFLPNGFTSY